MARLEQGCRQGCSERRITGPYGMTGCWYNGTVRGIIGFRESSQAAPVQFARTAPLFGIPVKGGPDHTRRACRLYGPIRRRGETIEKRSLESSFSVRGNAQVLFTQAGTGFFVTLALRLHPHSHQDRYSCHLILLKVSYNQKNTVQNTAFSGSVSTKYFQWSIFHM